MVAFNVKLILRGIFSSFVFLVFFRLTAFFGPNNYGLYFISLGKKRKIDQKIKETIKNHNVI